MSLVIQPGRVSSQRLLQLRGGKKKEKKNPQKARGTQILLGLPLPATETDGEEGRKKGNGNGMKRNEETRELRRESKSRKNKVTAGELVPGHAGSLERFPASRSPFCTQMRWTYCSGSEK